MLKEIKARYATQCAKCKRVIREGWTIFFNPDDKKTYCKPCGAPMLKAQTEEAKKNPEKPETSKNAGMEIINALIGQARLNGDLLASLDDKVRDLITDVSHLDAYIRDAKKAASTKPKK